MITWEEVPESESIDELNELKHWLFSENIRLQNQERELEENKMKFFQERKEFRDEMDTLNRKMVIERKRLKDDQMFFDKKMEILKNGFFELETERKNFEREKLYEKQRESTALISDAGDILFSGVNNPLGLKKRYKDLMKIYHPDNMCGSEKVVQMINTEYEKKRAEQ